MAEPTPPDAPIVSAGQTGATGTTSIGTLTATVNIQPVVIGPTPTQTLHPWRTALRTGFQALVAGAALAPAIYEAATHHDPAAAGGLAGGALVIAAGITRVMATPAVDKFLTKYVPFLAATPKE